MSAMTEAAKIASVAKYQAKKMALTDEKTCTGCDERKQISAFAIKKTINGVPQYRTRCKACIRDTVHARLDRLESTGSLHEQVALNRLWRAQA